MTGLSAFLLICHAALLVSADPLPPQNIQLFSENFRHVLTWDDPNNDSSVRYSVAYREQYSNAYVNAGACSNITARRCDLTKDFTDYMGEYSVYVKLFINQNFSQEYLQKRFKPILNTVLGPPIVDVVPCDRCIQVSIQPPVSYLWSEKEQGNVTMLSGDVYPMMTYTIHVVHSHGNSTIYLDTVNYTVIPNLLPRANYCISVSLSVSSNLRPTIPSTLKCAVTESSHPLGNTLLIVVGVVAALLLLAGILLLLISLDRAGYIFMGTNFVPKVLKSFSTSESMFSGSHESSQPICVVPVEIMDKNNDVEENHEKGKSCGEGYVSRKRLLSSTHSGTGDTVSSGQLPSATSSAEDSSGQDGGSSAEAGMVEQIPTGPDINVVSEGSCSSHTQLPVNATIKTSNLMFNNGDDFNINLKSVSIADPEEVWMGFRIEGSPRKEPEVLMSARRTGITLDPDNCRLLPLEISMDEWRTSPHQYDGSSEEEEDVSDNNEPEEHPASGYEKR